MAQLKIQSHLLWQRCIRPIIRFWVGLPWQFFQISHSVDDNPSKCWALKMHNIHYIFQDITYIYIYTIIYIYPIISPISHVSKSPFATSTAKAGSWWTSPLQPNLDRHCPRHLGPCRASCGQGPREWAQAITAFSCHQADDLVQLFPSFHRKGAPLFAGTAPFFGGLIQCHTELARWLAGSSLTAGTASVPCAPVGVGKNYLMVHPRNCMLGYNPVIIGLRWPPPKGSPRVGPPPRLIKILYPRVPTSPRYLY